MDTSAPRTRSQPVTLAGLAAVGAATTLASTLSWRQFTQDFASTFWPLVALAVAIAGTGALARWWRVPRPLVFLAQVVVAVVVVSSLVGGALLPVGDGWTRLVESFTAAIDTANRFAPPVPATAPPVHPLLIAGGAACLLLVDFAACTLRRVPLAGLPLLTIYSVPVSMAAQGPHWVLFLITAVGFLVMIFLSEAEQVARWGPLLAEDRAAGAPRAVPAAAWPRTGARAIGGTALVLAVVVPLALPSYGVRVFEFGTAAGGDREIKIDNPAADLQRDLTRGDDVPLIRVRTDDPDPSYLRVAVLNRFREQEWSSGDREVPDNQRADGSVPAPVGVSVGLPRQEYDYDLTATRDFDSTWLPTTELVSRVEAEGDWRYDTSTMDFLASDDDLDTRSQSWSLTAIKLKYDPNALAESGAAGGLISPDFLDVPDDIDASVEQLTQEVTAEAPTRFEKAVALQRWFRSTGGFTYDDSVSIGNGQDDLVRFLTPGEDGRRGYCEQFAAAMALMSRQLGIPARVAIGFLQPDRVGRDTWEYSAHDLHAWPELFFPGSGWVRFEPTPGDRADNVPSYTRQQIVPGEDTTSPSAEPSARPDQQPRDTAPVDPQDRDTDATSQTGADQGLGWLPLAGGALAGVLLVLLLLAPRTLRRRRRAQRAELGPEEAWVELHDTAVDLGLPWPQARSPRETGDALVQLFGPPLDQDDDRPRRGPETNPDAVAALDLLVAALERLRYARADERGLGTWRAETELCVEALHGGATRRARRAAEWWPRSVLPGRSAAAQPPADVRPDDAVGGRVVDHVG
jgi:transglutaminase-like putative cysteine protease